MIPRIISTTSPHRTRVFGATAVVAIVLLSAVAHAQPATRGRLPRATNQNAARPKPDRTLVYKKTPQGDLKFHLFLPKDWKKTDRRGAIVFFFGGGWRGGSPAQFYWHARRLADRGMVAISAEYRVKKRHGTPPFASVEDAKSAVRYVREHADRLGIDPNRVAASGGSAGGHLAVCTAVLRRFDAEKGPDRASSVPNAVVAFNPVLDTGPKGYGYDRLKDRYRDISPVDHIRPDLPPMLIFHGTADTTVPLENAERFGKLMAEAGNECRVSVFEGMKHGFFNHGRHENRPYRETMKQTETFLIRHGFLEAR